MSEPSKEAARIEYANAYHEYLGDESTRARLIAASRVYHACIIADAIERFRLTIEKLAGKE